MVFVIDTIPANEARSYKATISEPLKGSLKDDTIFRWTEQPTEHLELSYGDRPVLRYMMKPLDEKNREQTYKVYHHVYSPDGKQIITKGPAASSRITVVSSMDSR